MSNQPKIPNDIPPQLLEEYRQRTPEQWLSRSWDMFASRHVPADLKREHVIPAIIEWSLICELPTEPFPAEPRVFGKRVGRSDA